jgi:hypothetical protein
MLRLQGIHLLPSLRAKYEFHCANFHENRLFSKVVCAVHLGKYTVPDATEVSEKNMEV